MATVADTASVRFWLKVTKDAILRQAEPPIDDLPNLIIFYYMSMGFDANRRSITDRGGEAWHAFV